MAARWRLLTEYLDASVDDDVVLAWHELDEIVGGLPASAVDHHPQWWHGDRPNTRAWRAAGYELGRVEPGVSVWFVWSGDSLPARVSASQRDQPADGPAAVVDDTQARARLIATNPEDCLVIIPCSKAKRAGGRSGVTAAGSPALAAARSKVLTVLDRRADT